MKQLADDSPLTLSNRNLSGFLNKEKVVEPFDWSSWGGGFGGGGLRSFV